MSNWYVMRTIAGKEDHAIVMMQKYLNRKLWTQCRQLTKLKLFRVEGHYVLNREKLFPGYIFIQTEDADKLQDELIKSRKFPTLIGNCHNQGFQEPELVAVEEDELKFLQSICGEHLQNEMGLSRIEIDESGNILKVEGVLKPYLGRITKKRLRKRFVLAQVELFHRKEEILFGVYMEEDEKAAGVLG